MADAVNVLPERFAVGDWIADRHTLAMRARALDPLYRVPEIDAAALVLELRDRITCDADALAADDLRAAEAGR